MQNLSLVKNRIARMVGQTGSALIVTWTGTTGGVLNPSTGALAGGVETPYSGIMTAIAVQEVPRTVLRQFQEIRAGDLIVDCLPDPAVTILGSGVWGPGSGVVPLSSLAEQGVQFIWNGQLYAQAKIGEGLADIWGLVVGNVNLCGGMLLRRQT